MNDDELVARGKTLFERMANDDKRALKRFLTGQIQNILANEHGIGGSKGIREQVRARADERVNSLINDERFMEQLAERLAAKSRINFSKLITEAAHREAAAQIEKAVGRAASRVKVQVYIEPEQEQSAADDAFGKF